MHAAEMSDWHSRGSVVSIHARLDELHAGLPIPEALWCEFTGLGRDRYVLDEGAGGGSAQHEGSPEEAYKMVLLGC